MLPQIYLLLIHWFGDYYYQTGNMALGKGKSNYWLTVHVATYLTVLTIGTFGLYFIFYGEYELIKVCKFLIQNGVLHWITDYYTSRLANYYQERNDEKQYAVRGFDQFIHSATLLWTYENTLI